MEGGIVYTLNINTECIFLSHDSLILLFCLFVCLLVYLSVCQAHNYVEVGDVNNVICTNQQLLITIVYLVNLSRREVNLICMCIMSSLAIQ